MNISLTSTKVLKIELEPLVDESQLELSTEEEYDFRFDYTAHRPDNENVRDKFAIAFKALIFYPEESVQLSTIFLAQFETDEDFEDDYLNSKFALINAPAIGYPFLRAFISTILINSGYEQLILPTINFVKLYEKKFKESKSD